MRSSVVRVALLLLLAAVAVIAAGRGVLRRRPLPHAAVPASGTVRLAGLSAPVRLVTDRYGIPHLHARNLDDLYLAWGFVTARDRLWQIELSRRSAEGRLSEWFGNRALRGDGGAQLFELATRARRIWARDSIDQSIRRPLELYAAGINAYLELCRTGARPWPEEFVRLGKQPEDWKPADTVVLLLGQGVLLDLVLPELDEAEELRTYGAAGLAARHRFEDSNLYTTIPDSAAARLYGRSIAMALPGAPPSAARRGANSRAGALETNDDGDEPMTDLGANARRTLGGWLADSREERDRASNVFAVGPRRTARGKPILANDPHLPLTAPGALYVVHLTVPGEVDAIGATVPGLPAIVSGRNRSCAWGITALSADVIDVYADTLSRDGTQVRWNGGWAPIRNEAFSMRFRLLGSIPVPPIGQRRRYTPHGPVLIFDRKHRLALSARWAGRDQDISFARLLGLERSRSATELAERYRSLVTPGLNIVAADTAGRVIYQTVGAVPRRGFTPARGPLPDDGRHEWLGQVSPDSMPAWSAGPSDVVVNGNNLPARTGSGEPWPRYDFPHDRAIRMAQRLRGDPSLTIEDAHSVQNDVFSRAAERFVPRLLRCADSLADSLSPRARAALDTLHRWDDVTRRDRVAPTIYRSWYGALQRRSRLDNLPGLTAAALDGRAPEALRVPGGSALERPAKAAIAALELGLAEATKRLGPDLSTWTWGRAHRARFAHGLAWKDSTLSTTVAIDGDNSTPSVGRSSLPWSVIVTHGATFRHVVDLAVGDSSIGSVPPGNSGDAASGHRSDHLEPWIRHGMVPFYLSWDRIEAAKESEITLTP